MQYHTTNMLLTSFNSSYKFRSSFDSALWARAFYKKTACAPVILRYYTYTYVQQTTRLQLHVMRMRELMSFVTVRIPFRVASVVDEGRGRVCTELSSRGECSWSRANINRSVEKGAQERRL